MITFGIFLLTLGILVVFHEFGHYLFARLFKVKIITFSVGFGPKLFKFKGKYNEWCIGAIPLGGYVRMLDEREGEVPPSMQHMAFNRKKPYQKILIAGAGPVFNLIFAFFAYYILALMGVAELKPVISSINPELVQQNQVNIAAQSMITYINGVPVYSWKNADDVFHDQISKSPVITFDTIINGKSQQFVLDLTKSRNHYNNDLYLENLGLYPFVYMPIIAYIQPGSAAFLAKLQVNDKIVAINQQKINNWFQVSDIIQTSPGKSLDFSVIRQNKPLNLKVIPDSVENDGQLIGKVGIMPTLNQDLLRKNSFTHRYNVFTAVANAGMSMYNIVLLNVTGLAGIISGKVSLRDLSGPISIAHAGSSAFTEGLKSFIGFLALISIGLAVMNLIPIPVLDGGHIFIYVIEWLTGKEITYQVQANIFKIGFILLVGISLLAIYNDILRL